MAGNNYTMLVNGDWLVESTTDDGCSQVFNLALIVLFGVFLIRNESARVEY
jgi:hypothetical protein